MQIPILQGVWTDGAADIRAGYPVNMVPVVAQTGLSGGYLRPADGIESLGAGPGVCRGGINWNGVLYRVMGTKLVSITKAGVATTLGDVGGTGLVSMDYGFDRIALVSGGVLYYWNGTTLTPVTDTDLGYLTDVVWLAGYYVVISGTQVWSSDLLDPMSFTPGHNVSDDLDPDTQKSVRKLAGELYSVNRNSIQVYQFTGGTAFPFTEVVGGRVMKGAVGAQAVCVFNDSLAFIGSARNEAPGVYLATAGQAVKVSSREVDVLLKDTNETDLAKCLVEARTDKGSHQLWVHLTDRTAVYDHEASAAAGSPVWFFLTSSVGGFSAYAGSHLVWCYDQWNVGDQSSSNIGRLTDADSSQWGDKVRWEFSTPIVYNESKAVIFHQIELHAITGRIAVGADPRISTSFSIDGMTWSQDRSIGAGKTGERTKNLVWFRQGWMRNWRVQRFRGDSDAFISVARLEVTLEPLAV